jgi:DNA anti-recombination protein RmuC
MKNEEVKKWVENVNKKLGKEAAGKIADDLGKLITDTDTVNKELEKKDKSIESLQSDKEMLLTTNASLLQQVGEIDEPEDDIHKGRKEPEEHKPYNFRDSFDEYGNFKM